MSEETTTIALIADEGPEISNLTPRATAFLEAYRTTLTLKGAAKVTEMSRRNHYNWLHRMPGYREAFEKVDREVDDSFMALLVDRTVNGFSEERYGPDGELRESRRRHDASLLKMLLGARMPEQFGRESPGNNVTIVIMDVDE